MLKLYDTVIIGAGIAGASVAYALAKKGQNVLMLDKKGIATGGSGAAGAFVSPKIGKGSALQELTNEAFSFARDFYASVCPQYFHQTGLIRIPKDVQDANKFRQYESFNTNVYETYSKTHLQSLGIKTDFDAFFFPEAGDCDAVEVCTFLLSDIEVHIAKVKHIICQDDIWVCKTEQDLNVNSKEFRAKNIVLATGYESNLADLEYMNIKGTWGTRGDFSSALSLSVSMHQSISVGANARGIIKIGATHEKEVNTVVSCEDVQALSLKERAIGLIDTSDLELQKVFCGMRAGSKDYFPLLGKVIDVAYMLNTYPNILRGAKPKLKYRKNIYICNGLGGRGFVFSPLMAEVLSEHIVNAKEIDKRMCADRLFLKWCRKLSLDKSL
ncbi:MAG: FAD-dependent oxidoreductase [Epsilonproteobacteria bacterium]|nr:MAG: FAD-dependent oxidoreductase [Campylobacterota bacterium]